MIGSKLLFANCQRGLRCLPCQVRTSGREVHEREAVPEIGGIETFRAVLCGQQIQCPRIPGDGLGGIAQPLLHLSHQAEGLNRFRRLRLRTLFQQVKGVQEVFPRLIAIVARQQHLTQADMIDGGFFAVPAVLAEVQFQHVAVKQQRFRLPPLGG